MSLLAYLLVAIAIFAAGGATGIRWHAGQDAIVENARLEKVREQERANRATERQQSTNVIGAINAARTRETLARNDSLAARTELDQLRGAIAFAPRRASSTACPSTERADTLGDLLGQCAAAYQELAGKADRHASDALTLQLAWPK